MTELRPTVQQFAELMERKLRQHDDRLGWQNESDDYLLSRLLEEAGELAKACRGSSERKIAQEAADVANFAMMIADNALGGEE